MIFVFLRRLEAERFLHDPINMPLRTMADDKTPEEIEAQFIAEVAVLREQAAKSTDPLLVAKAIAAGDLCMQQVILSRLGSGERLVEVFAMRGSCLTEITGVFPLHTDNGDDASSGYRNPRVCGYDEGRSNRRGGPLHTAGGASRGTSVGCRVVFEVDVVGSNESAAHGTRARLF